jgi:hypothetical protein
MSGLLCPHCGKPIDLFKARGGQLIAKEEHLPLLTSLPIEPEVVRMGDAGSLTDLYEAQLPFTQAFDKLVKEIVKPNKNEDVTFAQK